MRQPLIALAPRTKKQQQKENEERSMSQGWRGLGVCTSLLCLALVTGAARAADYPNRTIRVVVPFGAAGVTDIVARVVFQHIAEATGNNIIVDNRPGAGGTLAVGQVVNESPDGYTLVMTDPSGSLPANVTLYPDLKYNPLHDLAPIAIFGDTGTVLSVNNQLPVKTIEEFVAYAKSRPGELTFASTGIGTPGHLNGELFDRLTGIQAVHVPYRVVGQGVTDLIAGRIAFWISPIPTVLPNIRQGQLRPLAVAGEHRSEDLPALPTMKEAGVADFDASTTYAIFGPTGTPQAAINWLGSEIRKALDDSSVQQRLRAAGVQPQFRPPQDITAMLQQRIPQWADVINAAGIKIN
jgi:tripartite-type tricarboxylate transporter receptor subunit TctC